MTGGEIATVPENRSEPYCRDAPCAFFSLVPDADVTPAISYGVIVRSKMRGRRSIWGGRKLRALGATLNAKRKPQLRSFKYQDQSSGSIRQKATGLSYRMRTFPTFSCM